MKKSIKYSGTVETIYELLVSGYRILLAQLILVNNNYCIYFTK